jgi:glycerol-1-phosphate dehydrogenase [NAD(P)+]
MIYNQVVSLPVLIENVDLRDVDLAGLFGQANLQFNSVLVLTGASESAALARRVIERNARQFQFELRDHIKADKRAADELRQAVERDGHDLILGVGGGRVLDTAKYVASRAALNYVAVPTVISSDALASPISILFSEGASHSYSATPPMGILIDRQTIRLASPRFVVSGVGDVISNRAALYDWQLAIRHKKERPNSFAKLLAEAAVSNLIELEVRPEDEEFIDTYVTSIILCGLAMAISGNSRPCSGAEHLLSHAIVKLGLSDHSHGFQVGSLTGYVLWLHREANEKYYSFIKRHGFHYRLEDLLSRPFPLAELAAEARVVRGDRYTILNELSDARLEEEYAAFLKYMDEI